MLWHQGKAEQAVSLEGPSLIEVSDEKEEDVLPCDNSVSAGVRSLLEGLGVPPSSLRSISMGHWGSFHWSTQCGCPLYWGMGAKGSCSSEGEQLAAELFSSPLPPVSTLHIAMGQPCCRQRLLSGSPQGRGPKCLEQIKNLKAAQLCSSP